MTKLKKVFISLATTTLFSACGAQNLSKNDPANPNDVHLEKHYQRVIRYNCQGQVTSDKVEVVKKSNQWVKVQPDAGFTVKGSEFRNRTSGDRADLITDYTTFQVKYTNGDLGMRVYYGFNTVDYKFQSCTQNPDGTCKAGTQYDAETGSVYLNVTYTEKTLSGYSEIREACPTPTPKP